MKRLARRPMLAILLSALLASACGGISPETLAFADEEQRPGRTTIRVATFSTQGLTDAIEQWEREHPTVEVVVDVRSRDDHHALMLEPEANSTTPDVVVYDVGFTAEFRNRTDLLVDLGELGAAAFEDQSVRWRWQQGVADDDSIVGLPADVGGLAVAYRTDLLGPNLSRRLEGARSWCELIEVGDEYSDRTQRPFLPDADELFEAILEQAPVRFHNGDGNLIHSTNPAVRRAWDLSMRAVGREPLFEDPCPESVEIQRMTANIVPLTADWEDRVRDGYFGAVLAPVWMLETLQSTAPSTSGGWRVTRLPETGAGNRGGSQLGIHRSSEQPDLAFDLISYLADPTTQLRAFRDAGNFPSAQSLYTRAELLNFRTDFFGDSSLGQIYIDSITGFPAAPDGPEHSLILDEMRSAVDRVESGNQTPQESWDEALWRIELFLK